MGLRRDNKDRLSTPPQTEDSAERGFAKKSERTEDPDTYKNLGRREELDPDNVHYSDIADEGTGHRG